MKLRLCVLLLFLLTGCAEENKQYKESNVTDHYRSVQTFNVEHDGYKFIVFYAENGRMFVVAHPEQQKTK